MNNFLFLSLFLCFISCSSKNNDINSVEDDAVVSQNDSIFIRFKIDKGQSLSLRVSNGFLEPQLLNNVGNGDTVNLFVGDEPSYVHVSKDITNDSGVYLKNGDSIEISYLNSRFIFKSLSNKNNIGGLNLYRDYYEYTKKQKPFEKLSADKKEATTQKNLAKILGINEKLYEVRIDFINKYLKSNTVDNIYRDSFLSQYKFTKLRLDYWDTKVFGNTNQLTEKYIEILNFYKKEALQTESLPLLFEIIIDYNKTIISISQKNDRAKFAEYLFNSIKTDFSEKNRDILVLQLLRVGKNKDLLNKFYNDFKAFSKNESFINRAKEIIAKNSETQNFIGNENTLLKDSQGNKITLTELLSKYKGNASYIDFWASWCAPCRLEMPNSLVASKKYTNIKFIYISTDQNEEQWKKANNKMLLNHNDSYLLLNESSSKFIKEINLSAIPRHIIFNKNGEISNTNAPGANDAQFENILNQY